MTDITLHNLGNLMFAAIQMAVASAALLVSVFFLAAAYGFLRATFRKEVK